MQTPGLATAVLLAVGCASSPFDPARPALDEHVDRHAWAPTAQHHMSADSIAAGDAPEVAITPPRTLAEWEAAALAGNTGLQAAARRLDARAERRAVVTSLPDPTLSVTPFGEMAETAAGEVELMTSVSQRFPLGGKLRTRGEMADLRTAAAAQELAALRIDVVAQVRRAWWAVVDAERALTVLRRDVDLTRQIKTIAQAKYRAGTAEQTDVLQAAVEASNLERRMLDQTRRRAAAAAMLNRLASRPADAAVDVSAASEAATDIPAAGPDTDPANLSTAVTDHPRLAALREEVAAARQAVRLARLERVPDLTVSAGYSDVDADALAASANGDDQWWVGFSLNLPIWAERYAAGEREARAAVREAAARLRDTEDQLAFAASDALAGVTARTAEIRLFEEQILPDARQALEAARGSYRAGRSGFQALIDTARRLTELDLMHQRALTGLQQDLADLARATGRLNPTPESR